MAFIKVDREYSVESRTVKLERFLKDPAAALYPLRLWLHAANHHSRTGELTPYDTESLEKLIGWDGEKGKAAAAMIDAGFIQLTEKGYKLLDWQTVGAHIETYRKRASKGGTALWQKRKNLQ